MANKTSKVITVKAKQAPITAQATITAQAPITALAVHTASAQTTTTGKYSAIANVCAVCGKPIVGGCVAGTVGSTCTQHLGKVGMYYKPAPANVQTNTSFITLVQLCNHAQSIGLSRGFAVKQTGGDAGCKPPTSAVFTVFVFGKRKYVAQAALQALTALAPKK
jgi:hypothetical protein